MKKLLLSALVVVILLYLGIVTFQKTAGKVTFTIDTDKAVETTKEAVEKGKEVGSKVVKEASEAAEGEAEEKDTKEPELSGEEGESNSRDEGKPKGRDGL